MGQSIRFSEKMSDLWEDLQRCWWYKTIKNDDMVVGTVIIPKKVRRGTSCIVRSWYGKKQQKIIKYKKVRIRYINLQVKDKTGKLVSARALEKEKI